MLFQRISRTDPEKIFVVAKNSYSTASLTNGQVVQWDWVTDKDGVSVTKPSGMAVDLGNSVAGVAAETIAFNDYGLIQVFGYHSALRVRYCTSADALVVGGPLRPPLAAAFCAESHDPNGTLNYKHMGFAMEAYNAWATTTIAAFIKAL